MSFCFISCLALSVFLYLSSTFSGKLTYVLVSVSPLILFHVLGPHIGPSLIRRPAPAHLDFHDPLWLQLITFPPSNLVLMCIHNSARLVVKLSAGFVRACVDKKIKFLSVQQVHVVFPYLSTCLLYQLTDQPSAECHIPTQDQQYLMTLEQQTEQPLSLPH